MKIHCLYFLIGLLLFCQTLNAQSVPFDKNLFKDKKEEFKAAKEAFEDGNEKYAKEQYDDALDYYFEAYKFNPNNAELNYRMGRSLMASYKIERKKSITYLEKAYQLDPHCDKMLLSDLGVAYHLVAEWDKAIDCFHKYKSSMVKGSESEIAFLNKQIEECKNGKEFQKNPVRVFVDNLGSGVNTKAQEYAPFITTDESVIYFTARREDTHGKETDESDGVFREDIYVSERTSDMKWGPSRNLGEPINSDNHDATAGLAPDGKTMFVYRGSNNGDLFESKFVDGVWTKPDNLNKNINTAYWENSASISYDGKTLYFISNRPDMTLGGLDIFMSKLDAKGDWGKPVNLGPVINTHYDEETVFAHPDGKTLYFSSMGHKTMGGHDVFKSVFENGKWSEPENLGYPVNSPSNEISFVINANGKRAYYAASHSDGYGLRDIYVVTMLGPEKPMILNTEDLLVANVNKPVTAKVVEPTIPVSTNQLTLFKGRILDSLTKKPLEASILMINNELNQEIGKFESDKVSGKFLVTLPSGNNYNITVKSDGYLFQSLNFDIPAGGDYQVVEKDVLMKKVSVGMVIVLNNIFFDHDKYSLRKESEAELENLHKLLVENPTLRIEISGHTDNNGAADYNQKLSENRAHAVVTYLVSKGIPLSRLEFKGYGLTKPVATNTTSEGRQLNRRTEFKVLSK